MKVKVQPVGHSKRFCLIEHFVWIWWKSHNG